MKRNATPLFKGEGLGLRFLPLLFLAFTLLPQEPEMILIPGGSFQMGSNSDGVDEKPVHTVTLDSFYLSKYEVTVGEFKQFIENSGYVYKTDSMEEGYVWIKNEWRVKTGIDWRCDVSGNIRPPGEYNHPVIHVSWVDAKAYCAWLREKTGKNYRLPTEAEWEYAAGGGQSDTRTTWAGTSTLEVLAQYASFNDNPRYPHHTTPVGSFLPNQLGVFDMSGNVNEWCADLFGPYLDTAQTNPTGPLQGDVLPVFRGGYWRYGSDYCRVSHRNYFGADFRTYSLGFRVACD